MDFQNIVENFLPPEWTYNTYEKKSYVLVPIPSNSTKYQELARRLNFDFNLGIKKMKRIQNPFLYAQFLIKKEDYESRGLPITVELFHDTNKVNVKAIASNNFDWRLSKRHKYGRGVNFSPSATYANAYSSPENGKCRAMIIADVLLRSCQEGTRGQELPDYPCDTTRNKHRTAYVKYYDEEFYPKYVIYYRSR